MNDIYVPKDPALLHGLKIANNEDVVEVVRCKDCELWNSLLTEEERQFVIKTNTDGVCELWMSDGLMPNDYCSKGKRREEPDGTNK